MGLFVWFGVCTISHLILFLCLKRSLDYNYLTALPSDIFNNNTALVNLCVVECIARVVGTSNLFTTYNCCNAVLKLNTPDVSVVN